MSARPSRANLSAIPSLNVMNAMREIVNYALPDEEHDYASWLQDEYGEQFTGAYDTSDGHIVHQLHAVNTFLTERGF